MKVLIAGSEEKCLNYKAAVNNCGYEADVALEGINLSDYDKLIVPGGVDVNPVLYKQENIASYGIDDYLDKRQYEIIAYFVEKRKPVFGICRGHQIINVFFGGNMIQDVEHSYHKYNDGPSYHYLDVQKDSYLFNVYNQDRIMVNSMHHQAVKTPGKDLIVVAKGPDGIIEATQHKYLPIITMQAHPEKMDYEFKNDITVAGGKIFEYFLEKM